MFFLHFRMPFKECHGRIIILSRPGQIQNDLKLAYVYTNFQKKKTSKSMP